MGCRGSRDLGDGDDEMVGRDNGFFGGRKGEHTYHIGLFNIKFETSWAPPTIYSSSIEYMTEMIMWKSLN